MNKIQTAEELFNDYSILICFEEGAPEYVIDKEDFIEAVKEFAKLHVKQALKAVAKKGYHNLVKINKNPNFNGTFDQLDERKILNAYPESNIK